MASNIKFKRSAVQNRVPTTAQLDLGELALNTYDGKLYTEINTGSAAVVEIGSKLSSLVVDGDNGAGGGDVTFHGATAGRDLLWDFSGNALKFADNTKAKFGTGGDLEIFHDATNSQILNATGQLAIENTAGNISIKATNSNGDIIMRAGGGTSSENAIVAVHHGEVVLSCNGATRLTTTADGADISGTGSLKLPVGTTAQRNSSPAAGDIRYNSTIGSFEGYSTSWGELGGGGVGIGSTSTNPASGVVGNRIGVGFTDINIVGTGVSVTGYGTTIVIDFNDFKPGSFHRSIHNYTATAGQTTFAGLNYVASEKQIAVYLNGARLSESTYTATSGTTVVLDVGASVGDEVEIINIHTNSDVDRKVNTYTATAGQTTFTGLSYNSKTELDVYLNGIRLASDDFTATSGTTVVLAVGASVNDTVDIVSTGDGVSFRSTADTSGDKFTLTNVGIGTDITPDKLNVRGNVSIAGITTFTNSAGVADFKPIQLEKSGTTGASRIQFLENGTNKGGITYSHDNNRVELIAMSGNDIVFYSGGNLTTRINTDGHLYPQTDSTYDLGLTGTRWRNVYTDHISVAGVATAIRYDVNFVNAEIKLTTNQSSFSRYGRINHFHNNGSTEHNAIQFSPRNGGTGRMMFYNMVGGTVTERLRIDGTDGIQPSAHIVPMTDSTYNLGSNGTRFANVYADNLYGNGSNLTGIDATSIKHTDGSVKAQAIATGVNVTGNLNVSGVLTYDDVTNVDSVGIVTARQGVRVTADGSDSSNYISVGAGGDLKLYHESNLSFIKNITGKLVLRSNTFQFGTADGTHRYIDIPDNEQGVSLFYDNNKKLEVTNTGATITGNLIATGNLNVNDNGNINVGNSGDLQLFHNGTNSFIDSDTGNLVISSVADLRFNSADYKFMNTADNETLARFIQNAAVELYYDNVISLETTTEGIEIKKTASGQTARLQIEATNGGQAGIELRTSLSGTNRAARIDMYNQNTLQWSIFNDYQQTGVNDFSVRHGAEIAIRALPDGAVELYHDNSKKFETTSIGTNFHGTAHTITTGNLYPMNDNTLRVGMSNRAWEQVNTYELHIREFAKFLDNMPAKFGNDDDLQIFHDGSFNKIIGSSAGNHLILRPNSADEGIRILNNAAVELYYDNSKKAETYANGLIAHHHLKVMGAQDQNAVIQMFADEGDNTNDQFLMASEHNPNRWVLLGQYVSGWHRYIQVLPQAGVQLYYDDLDSSSPSSKLETTSTGIEVNSNVQLPDGGEVKFGAGGDLRIFHANGNANFIQSYNGNNLRIHTFGTSAQLKLQTNESENNIICKPNGATELYHNNAKKFETASWGNQITGGLSVNMATAPTGSYFNYKYGANSSTESLRGVSVVGNEATIEIVATDAGDHAGSLILRGNNDGYALINSADNNRLEIVSFAAANGDWEVHGSGHNVSRKDFCIVCDQDGAVELYNNNTCRLTTSSDGVDFGVGGANDILCISGQTLHRTGGNGCGLHFSSSVILPTNAAGTTGDQTCSLGNSSNRFTSLNVMQLQVYDRVGTDLKPYANNTYDLGSTTYRWRNVYTNDLNLSNEGSSNDVDGTWGSYTIQEGEDDLFLINKRSGKKYKFNLTEVS